MLPSNHPSVTPSYHPSQATPLYRVDGAFAAIRKFALNAADGWGARLDPNRNLDPNPKANL